MKGNNYAPSYIEDVIKELRSWLSYNYADIRRKIKMPNARFSASLQNERVPTNEELELIMNAADSRTRVSMCFMAFAGLRPKSIGNDDGTDGLRLSEIVDLDVSDGNPKFLRMPAMRRVRAQLSKAGHQYFTVLTSQGCIYLLGYLRSRTPRTSQPLFLA